MSSTEDDVDQRWDRAWAELTAPGALYEVTEVEVRGRVLRSFLNAPRTLNDVWAASEAFSQGNYIVFGNERLTYKQAHEIVASVATWLKENGVCPGDRVAIAMRNYPEWILTYWACLSVGAIAVGMNAWWVADELAFALKDAGPKVVFCDAERRDRLLSWAEHVPSAKVVVVRAATFPGMTAWTDVAAISGRAGVHVGDPDDDACIFYTSGTTGNPKGARLTHRGCVNTLAGIGFVMDLARLVAMEDPLQVQPPPVALVTTPLFHVTANNGLAQPVTAAGGTLVMMHKWDAAEALRLIEVERVTVVSGVPTMMRELLVHPNAYRHDLSTLATMTVGGAQLPPDLVKRIDGFQTATNPSTGYGMTEACGIVSAISGSAYIKRPTSCGRPLPICEVRIVAEDGTVQPAGSIGEVCVKSPGVINGYWNRPDATEEAIVDGWLQTGDLGRIDEDGYMFIVDRKKDMVLRGGENVYCAEVEAAIYRHAAIAEACVFGVPDERLGEEVGVAVVLCAGAELTVEGLRAHVSRLIAGYKVPRYVWIMHGPLPRNASGKFLRRDLRAALAPRADSLISSAQQ